VDAVRALVDSAGPATDPADLFAEARWRCREGLRPARTPAGAELVVRSCGRLFLAIEVHRWPISDWPETARSALTEFSTLLAHVYLYRRTGAWGARSTFGSTVGSLHAPRGCGAALAVVLSAEVGDDRDVHAAIDVVVADLMSVALGQRRAVAAALESDWCAAVRALGVGGIAEPGVL
jgi:hypothetical protein